MGIEDEAYAIAHRGILFQQIKHVEMPYKYL